MLLCSTPFGIRDSTRLDHSNLDGSQVCSTPFGIRDSTLQCVQESSAKGGSAQRLSASEIRHEGYKLRNCSTNRAQRLSASEIRHVKHKGDLTQWLACSTPFGIRDSTRGNYRSDKLAKWCSTPFGIRDSTHLRTFFCFSRGRCSTPFGIRDSTHPPTPAHVKLPLRAQRLSASEIRHQQKNLS